MTTYYIYLIPYLRAGKVVYYCGYTNNPERRAREHSGEREWCGRLHVIVTIHDGTVKAAMKAERTWKKQSHWLKEGAYEKGKSP